MLTFRWTNLPENDANQRRNYACTHEIFIPANWSSRKIYRFVVFILTYCHTIGAHIFKLLLKRLIVADTQNRKGRRLYTSITLSCQKFIYARTQINSNEMTFSALFAIRSLAFSIKASYEFPLSGMGKRPNGMPWHFHCFSLLFYQTV